MTGTAAAHSQGEPGHVRTRDGRTVFVQRTAGPPGVPTVVLEAGMGATRSSWAAVQGAIAGRAPVVVYDRSGLGRSAPDPGPRILHRLAMDLNDVLDHVGADRYVLAGHSWGGPIVRVATAGRTERVAGLVLVDPTDEGCELYFGRALAVQERITAALLPVLARTGLLRWSTAPMRRGLPADAAADLRTEWLSPAGVAGHLAEAASTVHDLRGLQADPPDTGTVPVTVISGAETSGLGRRSRAALNAAHAGRAGLGPERRHVLALRSGHLVPLTEPDLVAGEILRLVESGRQ
ncbi:MULTISPECIES: alpha/beta fold hydrolase [Pseudonocardia]|uniref:Short chain dehydrogenase n=2 Tax=Pseudonocardia TaxID=1847 RepID=A0A1Y2MGR2_PSEAH|nr:MULTISPECIES: alpha/beta hydrolase [Pseudonocardia]OSY34476.1 short chain dehydrogenase [Pseudonocardia autotrophica]TDN71541.1 pimeloyl-ACP methyl ester carboxylesterase [Pseudonocardia autotrophica]BBG02228.1 hydrolase or acyltransferase of alpha/beta superfamily protein [Pseudonocardia autotrophica]GEC29683.1 hydrolase or acyltransferase of alpha/beta superfamily protein [Pseudonocardia saturnea]